MARTVLKHLTVSIRPASVVEWSNALHTGSTGREKESEKVADYSYLEPISGFHR